MEHEEDKIQRLCCFPGPSAVLISLSHVPHPLLSSWFQGWVTCTPSEVLLFTHAQMIPIVI